LIPESKNHISPVQGGLQQRADCGLFFRIFSSAEMKKILNNDPAALALRMNGFKIFALLRLQRRIFEKQLRESEDAA